MATVTEVMRHVAHFARNRIPGQLVIQFTNHCNARCPQCGMRTTARIARTRLEQAAVKRILDAAARQRTQAVSFTGGEPLLFLDDVVELIDYAGAVGIPYIRAGTNGFLFRGADRSDFEDRVKRLADRLAATPLRNFWISIDSAEPAVHEAMRGLKGVIKGVAKALPLFIPPVSTRRPTWASTGVSAGHRPPICDRKTIRTPIPICKRFISVLPGPSTGFTGSSMTLDSLS